jgi:drug/metabolite transporter (DMT)-like permease
MVQPWVALSLLAAILLAVTNFITKNLNGRLDEYATGWIRNLLSLPVLWGALFLVGIPQIDPKFWWLLLLILPLELIVAIAYFKAIRMAPLSLTAPISSFGPLFIAVGAFYILSEPLTMTHAVAFLLLAIGTYILNVDGSNKDLLHPLKKIKNETGLALMLLVGALFGVTIPIGKLLSDYSSPQFYTATYFSSFVLMFALIFICKTRNSWHEIRQDRKLLLTMGLLNGLFLVAYWAALNLGPAGPVTALLVTNVLITVVLAGKFLQEGQMVQRSVAAIIMMCGAVLAILG